MHLILPYAASHRWPDADLRPLRLPHLQQLLSGMQHVHTWADRPWERPHPLLPHERVWAQALGWPDAGPWPWAAGQTGAAGPQAWITLCHWQVGMDQVVMLPPEALALRDDESQQLLQAMQPYMGEDGLQVQWHSALRWLVCGELLRDVATASLARVAGANIRPWITDGSLPAPLRRLQSEMQMLLYNHPVNAARLARGQLTVNAFWLHGAGAPNASVPTADVRCVQDLAQTMAQDDAQAWQAAWQHMDSTVLAALLQSDTPLALTLCSETTAHTWQRVPQAWHQRWRRRWQPLQIAAVLQALRQEAPDS